MKTNYNELLHCYDSLDSNQQSLCETAIKKKLAGVEGNSRTLILAKDGDIHAYIEYLRDAMRHGCYKFLCSTWLDCSSEEIENCGLGELISAGTVTIEEDFVHQQLTVNVLSPEVDLSQIFTQNPNVFKEVTHLNLSGIEIDDKTVVCLTGQVPLFSDKDEPGSGNIPNERSEAWVAMSKDVQDSMNEAETPNLEKLTHLDLSNNFINFYGIQALGLTENVPNLKILDLSCNLIGNMGFLKSEELETIQSLENLNLNGNPIDFTTIGRSKLNVEKDADHQKLSKLKELITLWDDGQKSNELFAEILNLWLGSYYGALMTITHNRLLTEEYSMTRSGVTKVSVIKWSKGDSYPTVSLQNKIIRYMRGDVEDFLKMSTGS
ncbi:hypothetical protein ACFL21_02155 [Patescibacteria group bacterium]